MENRYYRTLLKNYMHMRQDKSQTHVQPGQSLVEFALALPLLVLVIAGIFDLGRAFYASITITNAAREGARYGTLHPAIRGNQTLALANIRDAAVLETVNSGIIITASNVTVTCQFTTDGCASDNPLTVRINYIYDDMILGFFFPSGIDMQRSVEMLIP